MAVNIAVLVAFIGAGIIISLAIKFGPIISRSVQRTGRRSAWRGLPLPVKTSQLRHESERETVYVLPGERVVPAAQWLENTWAREGYVLVSAQNERTLRKYVFQRRESEGTVLVAIVLVPPQFAGAEAVTSVAINDHRLHTGGAETAATRDTAAADRTSTRRAFLSGAVLGAVPFIAGGIAWASSDATGFSNATERIAGVRVDGYKPLRREEAAVTWYELDYTLGLQLLKYSLEIHNVYAPSDKMAGDWRGFQQALQSWLSQHAEFQRFYSWYESESSFRFLAYWARHEPDWMDNGIDEYLAIQGLPAKK
jgi:hypothetical protein